MECGILGPRSSAPRELNWTFGGLSSTFISHAAVSSRAASYARARPHHPPRTPRCSHRRVCYTGASEALAAETPESREEAVSAVFYADER